MSLSVLILVLVLQFGLGHGALQHEEQYIGHQHKPQHDMNVLLGDEGTDEMKKLNPAEQKKKMLEIVKRIDTNRDGLLSAEEMTLWIQHVYRKYALDDAEERFPDFDLDEDGVVTWEEYNRVTHEQLIPLDNSDDVLNDPEQESLRHLLRREKKRFEFADVDGKPGLNVTEFLAFTHPSEVDHMADFAVEDVLNEYDLDKDGFISLSEFIGDIRSDAESPSQWEIEETVRFKDVYDQDKDGTLNREEQLRWIAPNSYGSAREEALHLIKEMDWDQDSQISVAEVLKNQDTFMNSEVTDYGRQLHISHDEL